MKLSIIIPVYNENNTIEDVINRTLKLSIKNKEIIVVDDGSTDGTREILDKYRINNNNSELKIVMHDRNYGKGIAIQTGLKHTTGDIVCIQDADLEYNPDQIPKLLLEFINNPDIDAVFGSRFLKENPNIYKRYLWGNKFITFLINLFYSSKYTDSYTCYKLIKSNVLKKLNLESKRFEVEAEISIKLAKMRYKIKELPIDYNPRTLQQGKKIGFKDAIKGILTILKYKFK